MAKPIGHDLASFCIINEAIGTHFHESRRFRTGHYLANETVHNALPIGFRVAWNCGYIDHVAITVTATLEIKDRTAYDKGIDLDQRWGFQEHSRALAAPYLSCHI